MKNRVNYIQCLLTLIAKTTTTASVIISAAQSLLCRFDIFYQFISDA